MNAAAASPQFHGMFEMQHFVINDVVDGIAGDPWVIEYPADYNGVVGGIIVAQSIAREIFAPGQERAAKQTAEESRI